MLTVDYFGRTGNNLFQYVMARLIAVKSGLKLETPWCGNDFIKATPNPDGDVVSGEVITIKDNTTMEPDLNYGQSRIHLHGYFQNARHYNEHREMIKGFFELPKTEKNTEDIVVHLRLTDYWWNRNACVIHPDWYRKIIMREKYRKLYVVVEPHVTNKKYLSYLSDLRPEIISGTPKSDFYFLMSFDKIVCSNSTFAWWAAFLSNAKKIYIHKKWMGLHRMSCLPLIQMMEASVVDGEFIRSRQYEDIDWTDYWKKPEEYFNGKHC
jgi:hypothetical protein